MLSRLVARPFPRIVGLSLAFTAAVVMLTGCVRARADLTVSGDFKVSGTMIAATVPASPDDHGPQLSIPSDLGEEVMVQPYSADGYVGTQLSFSEPGVRPVHHARRRVERRQQQLPAAAAPGRRPGLLHRLRRPAHGAGRPLRRRAEDDLSGRRDQRDGVGRRRHRHLEPEARLDHVAVGDVRPVDAGDRASWMRWSVLVVAALLVGSVLVISVLALRAHRRSLRVRRR
ncbi:LppM family (lipo)protein [Kutzneria kofuensis]|uniref:LppM family (lipo)protein n=1 Tax=Kutzneria kofuensis TaxID=103725 RepID=UPI0031EE7965